MNTTFFQRILLPGFLLQSVLIGGGYATGRELVEFFLSSGPLGGFFGLIVATAIFSLISAISFEFARMAGSYNYRSFFKNLLGKGWLIYEIAYLALGILVLAVIGSAAGKIAADQFNLDTNIGIYALMIAICLLVAWGTKLIEKVLAGWSFLLYIVYAVLVYLFLNEFGANLSDDLFLGEVKDNWFINAVKYVGYNIAALPLILFCVRHMRNRNDSFLAGAFAGPLAMFPAIIFYLAMVAGGDALITAGIPSDYMMQQLNSPILQAIFYVVLFGTFVETGTAFIHAMNERVAEVYAEKKRELPKSLRFALAAIVLSFAIFLAGKVGLVNLIGSGYGTLTWVFIVVYVAPILSYGLYSIFFNEKVVLNKNLEQ
jgi:uncharacterized membrane protein YkvI